MGTVDHDTSYKLNPPHGEAQYALVTIAAKLSDALVVEKVQHLILTKAYQAKGSL